MDLRARKAMGAYAALALLAMLTLSGPLRVATLLFLGGLALKTWIAVLKQRHKD